MTHMENTLLLIPYMPTFVESFAAPGALGKDRQAERPPGPRAGFQLQARPRTLPEGRGRAPRATDVPCGLRTLPEGRGRSPRAVDAPRGLRMLT